MIPSAIDQRTIVLAKRKIKTERGVADFGAATRSSVSAIRSTIRNHPGKGKRGRLHVHGGHFRGLPPAPLQPNFIAVSKTMPALVKRERVPGLGLEEV